MKDTNTLKYKIESMLDRHMIKVDQFDSWKRVLVNAAEDIDQQYVQLKKDLAEIKSPLTVACKAAASHGLIPASAIWNANGWNVTFAKEIPHSNGVLS